MARPDLILDSNIVIDLLLQNPLAIQWEAQHKHLSVSVTVITVMEVLRGARSKAEMAHIGRFLARFPTFHLLQQDSEWAMQQFRAFWLSHQIGINDCLIAAIAFRTKKPIYTLNIKDFMPFPGLQVIKPY